jgi:NADH:ubiquinone reductase (H+-translocating)
MKAKQKVIVIGGGFAGIQLVRRLDEKLFDILLIDKVNHHQFQPLFYQVATSQLEPSSISFPLRHIFRNRKFFLYPSIDGDLRLCPGQQAVNLGYGGT